MKKLLIASTALVATAGVAAADVTLSGTARMGVMYSDANVFRHPVPGMGSSADVETRYTLNIDAATQTDAGVEFGARLRIRSNQTNWGTGLQGRTGVNNPYIYASANGFTVRAGNIIGAIEGMPNLYSASVGLTGINWTGLASNVIDGTGTGRFNWDAFSSPGAGVDGLEAVYSMDAFTFHVSASPDRTGVGQSGPRRVAAHAAYSFEGWTVAVAAQDSSMSGDDLLGITVDGNLGDFGVGAQLFDNDGITKGTLYGSVTFDQFTAKAFVARQQQTPAGLPNVPSRTTFGVGADYDLGGATLRGGIVRDEMRTTMADFGVTFSF